MFASDKVGLGGYLLGMEERPHGLPEAWLVQVYSRAAIHPIFVDVSNI